jgi:hypothetical protein
MDPRQNVESGQGFEIDFNEDSFVDLLIWRDQYKLGAGCISVQSGELLSVLPNDTAYLFYDSTGVLHTFNYLDTIEESANSFENSYSCPESDIYKCPFLIHEETFWYACDSSSSTLTGLFREIKNQYIAFKLKIADSYHYGWINFSKKEGVDFTIRAYAYNTIPEESMVILDPFYTHQETYTTPSFALYPNPASNMLTLEGIGDRGLIEILDLSGRVTFSQMYHQPTLTIPVHSLLNGVYILCVSTEKGPFIKKFIKE